MRPRAIAVEQPLGRGVHLAPWYGPNGEYVFLIVDSAHQLVTGRPLLVAVDEKHGYDYYEMTAHFWELLDAADPPTADEIRRRRLRAL